ncbi:MAG TPA: LysR family transcriptional regulator [Solirubrobacteraceae bacterium]|nr:LysR family transcriptional regulator [Solirubrobacteraceae bacterium]
MELRQLEYLAAVVSHGSFGRAAQAIYVTQSALSQQISRLEDELGLTLLYRGPKGVEPTPAGLEFLDHARAILGRVSEARAVVDDHLGAIRGVARVAATSYDARDLPAALAAFHRAHPQVQLAFQHAAVAQIVEQLATGAIDVAVLAVADSWPKLPEHITSHVLAEESLCLLTARGDQLSSAAGPAIDDLRGRSVIMPGRGTAMRGLLDDAFAQVGFSPLPRFETNDPAMIVQLVAAGLGVSIVPRSWLMGDAQPVAAVALADSLPSYRIALLATTQPRIPARDRLVEHLVITLGA